MKHFILLLLLSPLLSPNLEASSDYAKFASDSIIKYGTLADDYIRLIKHPDYWSNTYVGGKKRPSSIWTRAVFYEGHMAWYEIHPDTALYNYAYNWANYFNWEMSQNLNTGTHADYQCIGQTYIDLYNIDTAFYKIKITKSCMDYNIGTGKYTYWTWIDAIQMAMPIYAGLGKITGDTTYYNYMYNAYMYTRNTLGNTGTYNDTTHLWYRDANYNGTHVNSNGKQVYWSRGNGWVYAALVRVLKTIPSTENHYQQYLSDFKAMSEALLACQREDGFWNPSLADPNEYGGKETTGTGLFLYGLAWGINQGILDRTTYLEAVQKSWTALARDAIHPNGFLGWVQGTGSSPSNGQPLGYDAVPDFEDFGAGCVLLGAAESYKLSHTLEKEDSLTNGIEETIEKGIQYQYQNRILSLQTTQDTHVCIYHQNGQVMQQFALKASDEQTTNTQDWTPGVYIIRLQTKTNCQTFKIIR
jgi:unsaturated rhamnogalacturonyl hydrolase